MNRRRGGRPRAQVPSVRVSAWIPKHECDRLMVMAIERRQSVSSLVKELLRPWLVKRSETEAHSGFAPK